MKDENKTKKQLIDEMESLRKRIALLEKFEIELKQAEQDLRESVGRYFSIVEHTEDAIYVLFDRKFEFSNEQFMELFGLTREEANSPNFDFMTLVAPESQTLIREKMRQGYGGDFTVQQYDFTGLTKDNRKIECETSVLFIPYKWGVAIHGILRDVTMRKRINEELQKQRKDLQPILNSIPTSIFYTDRKHRFVQVNEAFCKFLGLSRDDIIGKTIADLFPDLPEPQLTHYFEDDDQVITSGKPKRGVIESYPAAIGQRWIQTDKVPYRDVKGNALGVICLAIDISDVRVTREKLWYLSFHDVLTGLYNQAYFEEEMARHENGRLFPTSIVTIFLTDLKSVNKSHGIEAGNELLRRTSQILKGFRSEDLVARIKGDTFAALLPFSDKSTGENVVKRIKDALVSHNKSYQGPPLNLSFGVATGQKGCSLSDVLKQSEGQIHRGKS